MPNTPVAAHLEGTARETCIERDGRLSSSVFLDDDGSVSDLDNPRGDARRSDARGIVLDLRLLSQQRQQHRVDAWWRDDALNTARRPNYLHGRGNPSTAGYGGAGIVFSTSDNYVLYF